MSKLLEKDPAMRITYEEVIIHPFWAGHGFDEDIEDLKKVKLGR